VSAFLLFAQANHFKIGVAALSTRVQIHRCSFMGDSYNIFVLTPVRHLQQYAPRYIT